MRLHDDIFGWIILALGLLEVVAIALASKDYSDVTFVDRRLRSLTCQVRIVDTLASIRRLASSVDMI